MIATAIQNNSKDPIISGNFKKPIPIECIGGPVQMAVTPGTAAPREKDSRLKYQVVCYQSSAVPHNTVSRNLTRI